MKASEELQSCLTLTGCKVVRIGTAVSENVYRIILSGEKGREELQSSEFVQAESSICGFCCHVR